MDNIKILVCILFIEIGLVITKLIRKKIYICIIWGVYVYIVLWLTILSRFPRTQNTISFNVLTAFKNAIVIEGGTEKFINTFFSQGMISAIKLIHIRLYHIEGVVLNVLLFVPLGYTVPALQYKYCNGISILLIAAIFSSAIELTQIIWHLGVGEIDDVINNSIGALAGLGLYKLCIRVDDNEMLSIYPK